MATKKLSATHTKLPKNGELKDVVAALELLLAILVTQLADVERRLAELEAP